MAQLQIRLFKRFCIQYENQPLTNLMGTKTQELLCYLLVNRHHSHSREILADVLWQNILAKQSRKYLRQALWELRAALESVSTGSQDLILVDAEWIGLNTEVDIWLDIDEFEQACHALQCVAPHNFNEALTAKAQQAIDLYQGEMLEGWYFDWCLYERERLQNMYLTILDKLMNYCEVRHQYEAALPYGERILRVDCAHERTHQRMIRCLYLSGDRTAALRQYEQCVEALDTELSVKPSQQTMLLYNRIRVDGFDDPPPVEPVPAQSVDVLRCLNELKQTVADLENQIRQMMSNPQTFG